MNENEFEHVHVVVQAEYGALETAEIYTEPAEAMKRYKELASNNPYERTFLRCNAEIEDIDI